MDWLVSDKYRDTVDNAARQMDGVVHLNDDIHHAWYLFGKIFDTAAENKFPVCIISGKLRKDFYDDLADKAEHALNAGCAVDVYVSSADKQDLMDDDNRFAQLLESYRGRRATLNCESLAGADTAPHMILVGARGEVFRYETDSKEHKALFAFGETRWPEKDMGGMFMEHSKNLISQYWLPDAQSGALV